MAHNLLYRLQRSQKRAIVGLAVLFLALSALWLIGEIDGWWFPLEPVVVFVGGLTTLAAVYWPFAAPNRSRRQTDRVTFDFNSNNGRFVIGEGDCGMTLKFSNRGPDAIYLYSDPDDVDRIALADGAGQISDIKDANAFDYSSRTVCPNEGQIVCLKGMNHNFACVQVHDIRAKSHGDDRNEVTFSYSINPRGEANFS